MSQRARLGVIVAAVAVAVAGFVIASSGGDDKKKSGSGSSTTTTAPTTTPSGGTAAKPKPPEPVKIVVKNAKPVGGVKEISVNKGDRVQFVVQSDVGDEIHVHGYDFMKDVAAGGSVSFDFLAKIDGAFEIELEGRKEQIAELKVAP